MKKQLPLSILIIYLLSASCLTFGQQPYTVKVKQYTEEEGFRARESNKMLMDRNGLIWIGSDEGLQRFDGYSFKWFNKSNTQGKIAYINGILEDDAGWLWLLRNAPDEILFFNPETEEILTVKERFGDSFPINVGDGQPNQLTYKTNFGFPGGKAGDLKLYFGVANPAGLITYDSKTGFHTYPVPALKRLGIQLIDSQNHIWASEGNIIYKLSDTGKIINQYAGKENTTHNYFSEYKGDIFHYTVSPLKGQSEISIYKITPSNEHEYIETLPPGYDWLNYQIKGDQLWRLDSSGWNVYQWPSHQSLFEIKRSDFQSSLFDALEELYRSSGNRMWVLTRLGLSKIDAEPNRFTNYFSFKEGKTKPINNSARGILVIGDSLYANFEFGGLVLFNKKDPSKWKILDKTSDRDQDNEKPYSGRPIFDDNGFLISGHENYLKWYNLDQSTSKVTEFPPKVEKIEANAIWSIYKDTSGCLWLGTAQGLAYKDPGDEYIQWFLPPGGAIPFNPKSSEILNIIAGPENKLWLCCRYGLYLFDPVARKMIARYWTGGQGDEYLPSDDVLYFYEDQEKTRWVGTRDGLIKWDIESGKKQLFTREQGLSDNTIYAIFEDHHQHLWLSTNYGINQFDKASAQVRSYLPKDGIPYHEFNRTSQFQEADGTIYFGSMNGVTAFHPDDFYKFNSEKLPNLVITDFRQFDGKANKLVDRSGEIRKTHTITLRPYDRYFRLEFALLSYNETPWMQYAWKTEGDFEKGKGSWNYQRENILQLGRLPYGQHTLYIKGQDSNGQWSSHEIVIQIKSLRPFYLQAWFLLLSIFSITATIIYWYKRRTANYRQQQVLLKNEIAKATSRIEQQTEELRQMDQQKSRLYTNITHEFRTPLTVISGMADRIEKPEQSKELIKRNALSLLRLVNQMLDLAKLEKGMLKPTLIQADVVPFVQYLSESFQSFAESKNINLVTYMETDHLIMDFDEKILHSIFSNFLSNAIKFTPEGGKIILHFRKDADQMVLKVRDTGIGISEKDLPHIFDRFYQVDDSQTREGQGTGIGLTLVKELVDLLHGDIQVNSKVGKGTEFMVTLPITRDAPLRSSDIERIEPLEWSGTSESHSETEMTPAKNGQLPLLLLIEDNHDVAIYIQSCLTNSYQVELAVNGAIGIEKALELVPDIIITDVMMPVKDGLEVCETLKNDERTSHIPIVMLTAKADMDSKLEGLTRGADVYLAKPFDQEELMIRLQKLTELRKKLQARYQQLSIPDTPANTDEKLEDVFLEKVKQILLDKLDEYDFSIDDLCKALAMSRMQLHRKLKALTGCSTSIFIRKVRLQKAREILQQGNKNVSEIAYAVGFDDPKYFSRLFSEEFGAAPSEFHR